MSSAEAAPADACWSAVSSVTSASDDAHEEAFRSPVSISKDLPAWLAKRKRQWRHMRHCRGRCGPTPVPKRIKARPTPRLSREFQQDSSDGFSQFSSDSSDRFEADSQCTEAQFMSAHDSGFESESEHSRDEEPAGPPETAIGSCLEETGDDGVGTVVLQCGSACCLSVTVVLTACRSDHGRSYENALSHHEQATSSDDDGTGRLSFRIVAAVRL